MLTVSQCFWINLPIGFVAAVVTFFFFEPNKPAQPVEATWKETILQLDLVGAALMIGLLTCYILALQYGGQTHPWKSSSVIGLLVGFVLLLAVFIAWELYRKEYAMIVPRIVSPALHQPILIVTSPLTILRSSQNNISGPAHSSWSSSPAPTSLSSTTCQSTSKASTTQTRSARVFVCWP
jgi:MFS family permease